ncbi:hypothetical protein Dimus_009262 [Dionaea muscipula]
MLENPQIPLPPKLIHNSTHASCPTARNLTFPSTHLQHPGPPVLSSLPWLPKVDQLEPIISNPPEKWASKEDMISGLFSLSTKPTLCIRQNTKSCQPRASAQLIPKNKPQ